MNAQLPFLENPDYLCVTGSRLYGTARHDAEGNCVSDEDLRGFVVAPYEYLIGLKTFDEGELEGDHKVYGLRRYMSMLLNGNAQALECLFAPSSHVRRLSKVGAEVLMNRNLFVARHFFKSISGFAYSEWRKVRGMALVVPERTRTEDQVIQDILNTFKHLTKDVKDTIIDLLYSQHEKKEVPTKTSLGSKRRLEYDKFGFCVSGASHAIRLLYQCIELLNTGKLTFPRPEAAELSRIKRGEVPFLEVQALYERLTEEAKAAYDASPLPERPDPKPVWKLYEKLATTAIREALSL